VLGVCHARAFHADIDIHEHADRHPGFGRRECKRTDLVVMIDCDLDVGAALERGDAGDLAGTDHEGGDQEILDAAASQDLGFRHLGDSDPDRAGAAEDVSNGRALECLGVRAPGHAARAQMAGHPVDVVLEVLQVNQQGWRIQLTSGQADRADSHVCQCSLGAESPLISLSQDVRRHQTWKGISNRLLYSRASRASAPVSWNVSLAASKQSFLPVRKAMLPMWQSRVLRWPISISAVGFARLLTQSRKFWTCSA